MEIRKIAIGPDYKTNAMHYIVGQPVSNNTQKIHRIIHEKETGETKVYIINKMKEVTLWKSFNNEIPISIEYNVNI